MANVAAWRTGRLQQACKPLASVSRMSIKTTGSKRRTFKWSEKDQRESRRASSIIGHFCFPYQGCGQETRKTTETYTGMLRQHSSMTKGGNGTISLLPGKSCHSLPARHSSFPLKMERVLLPALRLISSSKGMHAI